MANGNEGPELGPITGTLTYTELPDTTGSTAVVVLTAQASWSDPDGVFDSFFVTFVPREVWSGGSLDSRIALSSSVDARFDPLVSLTIVTRDDRLDFLAVGETLTFSADFGAVDTLGAQSVRTLTVTVFGANDLPTLAAIPRGSIAEVPFSSDTTDSGLSGALAGADPDRNDVLTYGIVGGTAKGDGTVGLASTFGELIVNATTGAYAFVKNAAAIEALAEGETAEASFTVFVADPHGGRAERIFAVDITGADEFVPGRVVTGTNGVDRLVGGAGDDVIRGLNGDDWLKGLDGDDILIGGRGDDVLVGGAGSDIFVFGVGGGADRVLDFDFDRTDGEFDLIALDGVTFRRAVERDVDGDGVIDTVIQLSNGSVTLMGTGSTDVDWRSFVIDYATIA